MRVFLRNIRQKLLNNDSGNVHRFYSGQFTNYKNATASLSFVRYMYTIGIRREDKNLWERRVPIVPDHVERLVKEYGATVFIQPSTKRVITDEKYVQAGATLAEDLSKADIILGVKEVPIEKLIPEKTYLFFSHTHKGQIHNMPLLQQIIEKRIRLIDYELMTDEKKKRLVLFSKFAGYAGTIDGLHALGHRLLALGYGSPFLSIGMSFMYRCVADARLDVTRSGQVILDDGLPKALGPMVFVITGDGNVSRGALHILKCLPHEWIEPDKLKSFAESKDFDPHKVYLCQVTAKDYIVKKDGGVFKSEDYKENPDKYESIFHKKIAPYCTMLINGIFWDSRYPQLITKTQIKQLAETKNLRLLSVADISCDINGSLEFVNKASTIYDPFYMYDPITQSDHDSLTGPGVQIMSIDNLPTEMPLEASEHFSASLFPFIKELIVGNFSHPVLSRATITFESGLTEKFKKLEKHIKLSASSPTNATKRVLVLGSGFVAGPLVDYLAGVNNYSVTVATNNLNEAKLISSNKSNVYVKEFDVSDAELLNNLISESDVVVSLLPASFHVGIAKSCIRHGKNLVTASYVSPEMQSLHELAKSSKVLLLNEIGLDPGIDHMSTMKRLASLSPDEKVISYKSWCGGLPAPEHTLKSISPIGYKFSWSPKGVLLATLKGAKYIDSKRMTEIPEGELMENVKDIEIFKGFSFEGIPNRDSIKYQRIYGLEGNQVETFFRGTLRYKGFCDVMKWCQQLKLLDSTQVDLSRVKSWNEYIMKTSPNLRTNEIPPDVKETLNWLGIFSDSKRFVVKETALDSFCELLKEKLVYEKEERDMVCMHHEFIVKSAKNERVLQSTLILYGEPHGFSAMAKTVGLPAAIATKLIMEGKITETGVVRPTIKEIYDPVLKELDKLEIKFVENESRK